MDMGRHQCTWVVLFPLRALQGGTLLPLWFQGLTALTGLECFVINELLCPGLRQDRIQCCPHSPGAKQEGE